MDKEDEMKLEWLKNNNDTTNMPEFEWYDLQNWILRNHYITMTLWSQGKVQGVQDGRGTFHILIVKRLISINSNSPKQYKSESKW